MKHAPVPRLPELPAPSVTRREFLVTSALTAGYALAAGPVAANIVSTDTAGLVAGDVSIRAADRAIPGYRAKPAGGGRPPVVLVVQEIFGLHEYIRDVCRRFAKAGYLAIAPDLYVRHGDVSRMSDVQEIIKVVALVSDAEVMGDLDAAAAFAAQDGGDVERLALTGFCWGGRAVWLYAAHAPRLKAGVAWYGRLVGEARPQTPLQPLDVAAKLRAPVLGLYGGADAGIPPEAVEKMRAALAAAGGASQIHVYPDAPHGFHADYRPSYREADALDGWRRTLAWFKDHGAGPS